MKHIKILTAASAALTLTPFTLAQESLTHDVEIDWSHFQGGEPSNPFLDHEADVGVEWEGGQKTGSGGPDGVTLTYSNPSAEAVFNPDGSTTRGGDTQTLPLLRHEQYHFDIAHIWAGFLQETLEGLEGTGDDPDAACADLDAKAEDAAASNETLCEAIQELYDFTTAHGTNPAAQLEWCIFIGNILKSCETEEEYIECEGGAEIGTDDGILESGQMRMGLAMPDVDLGGSGLASFSIDPLVLRSIHMGDFAIFGPDEVGAPGGNLTIMDGVLDTPLFSGRVLTMTGDVTGTVYTAWVQSATFRRDVALSAPVLDELRRGSRTTSHGVVTFEIRLPQPIDFDSGAGQALPATVVLGRAPATDPADCNADGRVDTADVPYLMGIIDGSAPRFTPVAGDLNGDGNVDGLDVRLMRIRLTE